MESGKGETRVAKPNQLRGKCLECGDAVEAGEGELAGKDGDGRWQVRHGVCPDVPVHAQWLRYVDGGARRFDGLPPVGADAHDWVPLNQAARDAYGRMPQPARRTHDEHRAEILARYGRPVEWEVDDG